MEVKTGKSVLAYTGVQARTPPEFTTQKRAPLPSDYKDWFTGTFWLHMPAEDLWLLVSKDLLPLGQQGNWIRLNAVPIGGAIETLTGNAGGAVGPDGANNVDFIGAGPYVITGNPGTNTLSLDDDGTIATRYDGDSGVGADPLGGVIEILGNELINTVAAGNAVNINLDRGNDGQVIIGQTGGAAAYSNITSAGGTIAITPGPNSLNIESIGGPIEVRTLTGNIGGAVGPIANNIDIIGAGPFVVTGNPGTSTLTIDDDGTIADTYTTNAGNASSVAGVLNVFGGEMIGTVGAGNTVTANLDRGVDGQIPIAATGGATGFAHILSAGGTVAITNTPNGINLETLVGPGFVTGGDNINIAPANNVNLNETIHWPDTNAAGTTGMIYLAGAGGVGGLRFMHNYDVAGGVSGSTFLGEEAGNLTMTSPNDSNTGIGFRALRSLTIGESNTAIGDESGFNITTGISNTIIGDDACYHMTTGSWNVIIGGDLVPGTGAGVANNYTGAESSNIVINHPGVTGDTHTIRIGLNGVGNRQVNRCFIAGIYNVALSVGSPNVIINALGQLGAPVSSIRYKQNVKDMANDSSDILDLRPVSFELKEFPGVKRYGLIAEEVEEVFPYLVCRNAENEIESVAYNELPVLLLNEIKKLKSRIEELEKK